MNALLPLAFGALRVVGTTVCPDPSAVEKQLRQIEAQGSAKLAPGSDNWLVVLRPTLAGIQMWLFDPEARLLEQRVLIENVDCAQLARAMAVVAATWEAERSPVLEGLSPLFSAKDELDLPRPSSSANASLHSASALRMELGLALLGSLAGGHATYGATVDGSVGPANSPWSGELGLIWESSRPLAFGNGIVNWQRLALDLGPRWRHEFRSFGIEVAADLLPALAIVDGESLVEGHRPIAWDLGIGAGGRLWLKTGPVLPWIGVKTVGWLDRQELAGGNQSPQFLPRFELFAELGVNLTLF